MAASQAGTKTEQIAHLQGQKAITSEQLGHLENAKQAADQAAMLPGYKSSQDQYDPSTVDIKITNAKQVLSGIEKKLSALKSGKTTSESVAGTKPEAGANTYAKQMPGKVKGDPHSLSAFKAVTPAEAVTKAQALRPSSAFLQIPLGDKANYDQHLKPLDTIAKSLSPSELTAVDKYTGAASSPINHALYASPQTPTGSTKSLIDTLTTAIDKSPLPTDMVLSRGVSVPAWGIAEPGSIIEHANFASTSTTATPAFSGHSTHLIIEAPKGTKALFVQNISAVGSGEHEVLLQRGYRLLVMSNTKQHGKNIVRVRVLLDE